MYVYCLCIVLYCIVLYCIVLYCIVLYCIVLYCIESESCLTPTQQFFSYIMQVNFQWDYDKVRFVLDQHAELTFYSASSLKQQVRG